MDIQLDGGEVQVLKAIGLGGTRVDGETMLEKIGPFEEAQLLDTLKGLITLGYVNSDKQSIHTIEDIEHASFSVNTGYSRDLRDAIDPRRKAVGKPSRRVRRE